MPSGMREGFIATSYSEHAPTRGRDQPRLSGSGVTSAPTYGLLVSMNRGAGWPVYLV